MRTHPLEGADLLGLNILVLLACFGSEHLCGTPDALPSRPKAAAGQTAATQIIRKDDQRLLIQQELDLWGCQSTAVL